MIARESDSSVAVSSAARLPNEVYVVGNKHEGYKLHGVRIARSLSDRYACRTQRGYGSEMVAFGVIVLTAIWPMLLLAEAMALAVR